MSRISDGATRSTLVGLVLIAALFGSACKELDGRNGNRKGNRLFRDMQFIEAAAEYEKALKQFDDPIVHYNLGLAYSKLYRPGLERPILLGELTDPVCAVLPNTTQVKAQVCIKKPDAQDQSDRRRFNECDEKEVCPSSFECKATTLCASTSAQFADLAAAHLQVWIKAQPADDVLQAELKKVREAQRAQQAAHEKRMAEIPETDAERRAAQIQKNKNVMDELDRKVEALTLKNDMRQLASQVWIDTNQFPKALAYWESELSTRPNDAAIMSILAGINLKANDWRKSIGWYLKVADAETDVGQKVASYQSVGNVAWSKLNSKTLTHDESVELADFGIGALQRAVELQPKNARLYGLQGSILNFRSLTHGASLASAIDRAHAQDLLKLSRVLSAEAKKQQQSSQPAPPAGQSPTPPTPSAPASPAPASPSMSGGPATKTGG